MKSLIWLVLKLLLVGLILLLCFSPGVVYLEAVGLIQLGSPWMQFAVHAAGFCIIGLFQLILGVGGLFLVFMILTETT